MRGDYCPVCRADSSLGPGVGRRGGGGDKCKVIRGPARLTHLLLCMSRCLCRENGVRNRALHSSHWNGLSSEWVCGGETDSGGRGAHTSSQERELQVQVRKRREGDAANNLLLPVTSIHPKPLSPTCCAHGTSKCPFTFLHQIDVSYVFIRGPGNGAHDHKHSPACSRGFSGSRPTRVQFLRY